MIMGCQKKVQVIHQLLPIFDVGVLISRATDEECRQLINHCLLNDSRCTYSTAIVEWTQ